MENAISLRPSYNKSVRHARPALALCQNESWQTYDHAVFTL